ncbi:MAG: aconitate hydratase, partial [Deltaproteobacteria bacterium]|nr:aconitate hydratase [Deltaproteobacteria bacterium]
LKRQGRIKDWALLEADADAAYDETDEIDLSRLTPLIACPSSPDNVKKVTDVEGTEVSQVIIGSSVNFSFRDMMTIALALKGKTVHPGVSLEINPGSRQVMENVEKAGGALILNHAGARTHQSGCLGCIGMGQAPATGTASVRTFPRNFPGRSGTEDDRVYLSSPEVGVAAAIMGVITDPRKLGAYPRVKEPERYVYNSSVILKPLPPDERKKVKIIRGPNIAPFPLFDELPDALKGAVLLKLGDNVTTDDILPAGNKILPLRSNIPEISEYVFERMDKTFVRRCKEAGGGIIAAGENYGQGSSREHAAICPRYLGVRVKIAKGFARIHRTNLINFGIVPLTFKNHKDYDAVNQGDTLELPEIKKAVEEGKTGTYAVLNGAPSTTLDTKGLHVVDAIQPRVALGAQEKKIWLTLELTMREREIIQLGGLLNHVKKKGLKTKP